MGLFGFGGPRGPEQLGSEGGLNGPGTPRELMLSKEEVEEYTRTSEANKVGDETSEQELGRLRDWLKGNQRYMVGTIHDWGMSHGRTKDPEMDKRAMTYYYAVKKRIGQLEFFYGNNEEAGES